MADFTSNNDQPAVHATNTSTGGAIFADGTSGPGLAATSVQDVGVHSANHSEKETAIFGINDTPGKTVPDDANRKAGAGSGVWGHTRVEKGAGVVGSVEPGLSQAVGVVGLGNDGVQGVTNSSNNNGVFGRNQSTGQATAPAGGGVFGLTLTEGGCGVFGTNNNPTRGRGVQGNGPEVGVRGFSDTGNGVLAQSNSGDALQATTTGINKSAVFASNNGQGDAPTGGPPGGNGVFGVTTIRGGAGVFGTNNSNGPKGRGVQGNGPEAGVGGFSDTGAGVLAQSNSGIALLAQGPKAGQFVGDVEVTGNINGNPSTTITCFDVNLLGQDCAEEFDLAAGDSVAPGTVMVINNEGALQACQEAYDRRVAGIVSGAEDCKPGITLGRRISESNRMPIALVGKVYCKADARYGHINIGDLLTTSPTPGHAMKADDALKAFGAVIGKALRPLIAGEGLIPILVALQ